MKFQPGKTKNEGMAIYVHKPLFSKIKEFDNRIDLNYSAISCTKLKKEKIDVVCSNDPPSVTKHHFLEHSEVLRESCCEMSNCFLVNDMNIDLHESSAIGNKYLNSL